MSLRELHPAEYRIWKGMRARCSAKSCAKMGNYQKLGIKVCSRWNSFSNFFKDMGVKPNKYTIDRIDNSKGYFPENCRWASYSTQARNRGNFNINIAYNGKTQCIKDWSKEFNIDYTTLIARVKRFPEKSFDEIIKYIDPRHQKLEWNGALYTRTQLCNMYNIPLVNFYDRYHKGWSLEKILNTPVIKKL